MFLLFIYLCTLESRESDYVSTKRIESDTAMSQSNYNTYYILSYQLFNCLFYIKENEAIYSSKLRDISSEISHKDNLLMVSL